MDNQAGFNGRDWIYLASVPDKMPLNKIVEPNNFLGSRCAIECLSKLIDVFFPAGHLSGCVKLM
jgi:hypothetical protein